MTKRQRDDLLKWLKDHWRQDQPKMKWITLSRIRGVQVVVGHFQDSFKIVPR